MFRGSVKSTGYPLHSPVSPSLPLPCATVCHHISTGLYYRQRVVTFQQSNVPPDVGQYWIQEYIHIVLNLNTFVLRIISEGYKSEDNAVFLSSKKDVISGPGGCAV